jgi:hypothetical protein
MAKKPRVATSLSLSAIEDAWQRQATSTAIAAARGVIQMGGPIPPGTPVGRLNDTEWGWIVCAVLFGWIETRARQATGEGLDTERTLRTTYLDPDPWDAGAVETILPELAGYDIDWSLPLAQWPRETMVDFLTKALSLIRRAIVARDFSDKGITQKSSASSIARGANAAAGGPLMTPDEFNDEIGL